MCLAAHENLDERILEGLGELGEITFVQNARARLPVKRAIRNIKKQRLTNGLRFETLIFRFRQFRFVRSIAQLQKRQNHDYVVFLNYETLSFSVTWPKSLPVLLFDHNNVDEAHHNFFKRLAYKFISPAAHHVVFEQYISDMISNRWNRPAHVVPHPYQLQKSPMQIDSSSSRIVTIFSPSGSTSKSWNDELVAWATCQHGEYRVICKGLVDSDTPVALIRKHFDDYYGVMESADFVYFGIDSTYRTSGPVNDALAMGRIVILTDSEYARDQEKKYPRLIRRINSPEDFSSVFGDRSHQPEDHSKFIDEHSPAAVKKALRLALDKLD